MSKIKYPDSEYSMAITCVEDMPAVEQQRHHRNGNKGRPGRQKRHKQILSRACVDAQAAEDA